MNPETTRVLSLAGNYIITIAACTVLLRPRLAVFPTVLLCTVAILGSSVLVQAGTHAFGHGRAMPILLAIAAVLLLFRDPLVIKITAICQVCTIAILIDTATALCGAAFWHVPFSVMVHEVRWIEPVLPARAFGLILTIVFDTAWVVAWRKVIRPFSEKRRNYLVVLLSIQGVVQAFLVSELAAQSADKPIVIPMMCFLLALGVSSMVLLFVFFKIFSQGAAQEAREATLISEQMVRARFIQDLQAYAGGVTKMRQNVQDTLSSLRSRIERGDSDGIDEIMGNAATAQNGALVPFSRSMAVSSLLAAKMRDCGTLNIRLLIRTRMDFRYMREFDACTVLSNLLDNAIRAARRCEAERRWITLAISRQGGLLMLVCRNPYNPEDAEQRSPLRHGMGVNIVRAVAAQYGGTLEISRENNVFTAVVTYYTETDKTGSGT